MILFLAFINYGGEAFEVFLPIRNLHYAVIHLARTVRGGFQVEPKRVQKMPPNLAPMWYQIWYQAGTNVGINFGSNFGIKLVPQLIHNWYHK